MSQWGATLAHDPVCGVIEARPFGSEEVARVFTFPPLRRLAAIKQLPFASQRFLGAEHTRHSHALGTYRNCAAMIERLLARRSMKIPVEELRSRFGDAFKGCDQAKAESVVIIHTLAAALLQDIGELPYGQVTENIFVPQEHIIRLVSDRTGSDASAWSTKDLFSVACIWSNFAGRRLEEFNLALLSYLIAPGYTRLSSHEGHLQAWINILHGQLDADRLDYVYRDAYHTIGARGGPDYIIRALIRYDEDGPVLENTGAVTDFLTLRANLWRSVYLDGRTRLGQVLLRQVLNFVQRDSKLRDFATRHGLKSSLSIPDFMQFDDHCLWRFLALLKNTKFNNLDPRTQHALDLILGDYLDYSQVWISGKPNPRPPPTKYRLPNEVFYDAFDEIYEHSLYRPNGIFIQNRLREGSRGCSPLENCVPHYGELLTRSWKTHPMPNHVQIHLPRKPHSTSAADWQSFEGLLEAGDLFDAIPGDSSQLTSETPIETLSKNGFRKPIIGLSFAFANEVFARKLLRILYLKKQHYVSMLGIWAGYWNSTRKNSQEVVERSDVMLCLLSKEYIDKYHSDSDGDISSEVFKIIERLKKRNEGVKAHKNFAVKCISLDPIEVVRNFPWKELNLDGNYFVGPALRSSGMRGLTEAIDEVLRGWRKP